jgi:hypothetical protein
MSTDVKKEGATLPQLNKEEVINKVKDVAQKYPIGECFSPDEVYKLIPTNECSSRMEFIEYIHSIHGDFNGLTIHYRGNREAANNYGNCTGLSLQ